MELEEMKDKAFWGSLYRFGERFLAQSMSLIVSFILARLLLPDDYGSVAIVMVFINIANIFATAGFGEALIQKRNVTDNDYTTMMWCSVSISVAAYLIIWLFAPYIAQAYGECSLVRVLRVLALSIPLGGYNTIQQAYVNKNMLFKNFFYSTLAGTLISGVVGVGLAYQGAGVWALVAQSLTNSIIDTIMLGLMIKWKPRLYFSKKTARELMSYSWKITLATMISSAYDSVRGAIIGYKYSGEDLAFYNKGEQIPKLVIQTIDSAITGVLFPVLGNCNQERNVVKNITKRALRMTSFVVMPMMVGLFVLAEKLIVLVLTEKWLSCVFFFRCTCVYLMFQPGQTANWQVLKAMGRSDLCLKYEIVKKGLGIISILVAFPFGVHQIAIVGAVMGGIMMIINIYPNREMISYGYKEQFLDMVPFVICSVIMGILVSCVGNSIHNDVVAIVVKVIVGAFFYITICKIGKVKELDIVVNKLLLFMNKS